MHTAMKKDRLEARLSPEVKERLEQAAKLEGRTLTDFVIDAALGAASTIIERHQAIELSAVDRELFFRVLMDPPAPNEALREAARRYRVRNRR